jgi:hypothetical protein
MEETYTISTVMAAVQTITTTAREGGEVWEAIWGEVPSEHNAEQVRGIFARPDWFGSVCLGLLDGIEAHAFFLVTLYCDRIVRGAGMFTRSNVGVLR